jgi:hypothetical protein
MTTAVAPELEADQETEQFGGPHPLVVAVEIR